MSSLVAHLPFKKGFFKKEDSLLITSASRSHAEDLAYRQKRYVYTQGFRILFFVLAVALPVPMVFRMLLIALGIILPLMGVVAANAGPVVHHEKASTLSNTPTNLPQISSHRVIDQD